MNNHKDHTTTMYNDFEKIKKITKPMKEFCYSDKLCYTKMCPTGNIELCDYNVGMLCVVIETTRMMPGDVYHTRIRINTIDDGDMGGWSEAMSLEKANELTTRIANEVFKDMGPLPCLKELNKQLFKYDIVVIFE